MTSFYCLLGNTPKLSVLELIALVGSENVEQVSDLIAEVQLSDVDQAKQLMNQLGGVVKICQPLKQLEASNPQAVETEIAQFLISLGQDKVTFGVAEIGRDHQEPVSLAKIKKALQKAGVTGRYIESARSGLSASVLVHHSDVLELAVFPVAGEWCLGQTVAIQDIDAWSKRDRSKPYADRRKGMLPPKVARMMVNLALGNLPAQDKTRTVYDPFCGTGTVLLEALMLGCQVVGSDLDPDSVTGTTENLAWLIQEESLNTEFNVFTADVAQADLGQVGSQVDAIVTEPFLGKPTPRVDQLGGIFKGLHKMYLGAFKQWRGILADGGVVVMVFPYVEAGKRVFSLEDLIDKLASLGYTIVSEPVLYRRPQAVVQRQIHIFRYQTNQ